MGFWKTFGKIALPVGAAIAAPFTGGASMAALLGAGAGAASGALDGGWKGALKGGIIGGATGGLAKGLGGKIPGLGGAGKAAGATNTSAINSLLSKANVPMGSLITDPNAVAKSGGGGLWSTILGAGKKALTNAGSSDDSRPGQNWADMGQVLGGSRANEMSDRLTRGEFMQNYDRLNTIASEENRNRENDALQNLARTNYILSGGAQPLPTRINSGNLTDLGFGPKPSSDAQKQGAATLQTQLLSRLTPEGSLKPTDPSTYATPGKVEKASKWGSLLTNGIGAVQNFRG